MRMRAVAIGLLLIVLSTSSVPGEQLESVESIEDTTTQWEGEATPTLVYEGVLSDPQDTDNISLGDAQGVVHFIQLVHADQPLKIEVREDGLLHGQDEANTTQFWISGLGNPMWIEISSTEFTSPNSYRILVHSNAADEVVELENMTASGYIHESDSEGDLVTFTTGGNAEIEIDWWGSVMTEFTGQMRHTSSGESTPLEFSTHQGNMTIHTPVVDSRFGQYEISIIATTDTAAAPWSVNKTIHTQGDALCFHD